MRVSTAVAALALPFVAVAESPFEQYKAQFQNFLSSFGASAPKAEQPAAASSSNSSPKFKEKPMNIMTLGGWKETLYAPVKPDATKPEEWWVLISGRNKSCFGHCLQAEAAFNETATKFATLPNTPHMGLVNCDAEAVLCSVWSAAPGSLWVIEMLPPPAEINIYRKRLNLTTVDTKTFAELQALGSRESLQLIDSVFHPFDGWFAKNGLALPVGYFIWVFNLIPNWLFMIVVSFASRTLMTRRMDNHMNRPAQAGAAPAAPAAAR